MESKLLDMTKFRGFPFHYKDHGDVIEFSNDEKVNIGDIVNVRANDGTHKKYPIVEIIETRPAKGDWSKLTETPDWYKVKIKKS